MNPKLGSKEVLRPVAIQLDASKLLTSTSDVEANLRGQCHRSPAQDMADIFLCRVYRDGPNTKQ